MILNMTQVFRSSRRGDFKAQFILVIFVSLVTAAGTSFLLMRWMPQSPGEVSESSNLESPGSEAGGNNYPTGPIRSAASGTLRDLNETLVNIAEQTKPSVVTVFTEQVVKVPRRRMMNPFFGAPGFDQFFEDFFGGPRQRQEPEQTPFDEFRRQGLGSGVIFSEDGYVLTNNHVIANADQIRVRTLGNQTYEAKVIGRDPKTDIAVIKVEAKGLRPIRSGDSDNLRVGEFVLAVGSPMNPNLAHTVTQGIVSAKGRSNVGLADYEDFIQTDAAINPGNSGGALINIDGELIGINTAIVSQSGGSQGIGFAVPINMARSVMQSLIDNGEVVRGWLGVMAQDLTEELVRALDLSSQEGVLISDLDANGPAQAAGLQAGDVVTHIDGEVVASGVDLRNRISQMQPGKTVELSVIRSGKKMKISVTLARVPAEESAEDEAPAAVKEESSEVLGFSVSGLSPQLKQQLKLPADAKGVVVREMKPDSPAARAGLREGDVISSVNRKSIASVNEFVANTKSIKKGQSVLIQVIRQGMTLFLAFKA